MSRLLMLDSGAFSVWSQGKTVDLEEYIDFCRSLPEISYYVNLDVIPGKPGQREGRHLIEGLLDRTDMMSSTIEASCQAGWSNYLTMLKYLPFEKVIPVFHQDDDFRWLNKYIRFGTPYLGISPANDRTTSTRHDSKARWMSEVRPHIFAKDGTPLIKTHGFAVTSFDLMTYWDWYSVDSASWKLQGAWGGIYIPNRLLTGDKAALDYSKPPWVIGVSPMSSLTGKRDSHLDNVSPQLQRKIHEYIESRGFDMGEWSLKQENASYKLDRDNEIWFDKKKYTVMVVKREGLGTSHILRGWFNADYMKKAAKVLPVKHLYFAGAPLPPKVKIEPFLDKRLFSFIEVNSHTRPAAFTLHLDLLKEQQNAVGCGK